MPGPSIPPLYIISDMLTSTLIMTIITYVINYSLAELFAKKHRYKINTTQEMLAYGVTNLFTGFFPCFVSGASLARSCVQDNAGGKTQVI